MRSVTRAVAGVLVIMALSASAARAQGAEFSLGGGLGVPLSDFDDVAKLGWHGLAAVSFVPTGSPVGIQIDGQYHQFKLDEDVVGSGSLNDNVPANTGVPTYQFTLASSAAGAGGHAFWEWGTRGLPANEVARMHRVLTAALIVSGFHAADGTVVQPAAGPIGKRTREVVR